MTFLQSIILGVVEGITEFLPISSTAHLIITAHLLKIPDSNSLKSFLIAIQLGAILSVAVLYAKTIIKSPSLILKIGTAFVPTVLIGLTAYKLVKAFLMNSLTIIAIALILGGVALIILEKYFSKKEKAKFKKDNLTNSEGVNEKINSQEKSENYKETDIKDISYKNAALIGVFQTLAIIPGVSRSAATIMSGLLLGVSRKNIVEFSFLLALPTMAGATALDLYKEPPILASSDLLIWATGLVVAFFTAVLGIKFFLRFIQKNNFIPFGWYRIILGIIILITLFI